MNAFNIYLLFLSLKESNPKLKEALENPSKAMTKVI